jgi:hypothetical protein
MMLSETDYKTLDNSSTEFSGCGTTGKDEDTPGKTEQ